MTWNVDDDLDGEPGVLRVSASDVASSSECERFMATKVRRFAYGKGWKRRFAPNRHPTPFPLGDAMTIAVAATRRAPLHDYEGLEAWIRAEIEERSPSRLVRPYLDQAVRNAIEAHEAIEHELGELSFVTMHPEIGPEERRLTVWGPLYATSDGVSEIRRFRVGPVHAEPTADDKAWVQVAAWVAATTPTDPPPVRVRVVEIGLADASTAVLFDDAWDAARAMLDPVRDRLQVIPTGTTATPCNSCGDCKLAGVCDALPGTPGALGQPKPGHETRSISPSALEVYRQCPARWLLNQKLHLPREEQQTEAQVVGLRVHEWLHAAHSRGVPCGNDDLPNPDDGMGFAESLMTGEEYAEAFPLLVAHVGVCPLAVDAASLMASERTLYSYDEAADVVLVSRPDLMTSDGQTLVLSEVKTSLRQGSESLDDPLSRTLQVPVLLSMLRSGLARSLGFERAEVRLEYLTPAGATVWTWSTDSAEHMDAALARLSSVAGPWHVDHEWQTRPGSHCAWCPVRQWCPDRDVYLLPVTGADAAAGGSGYEEAPPF
jgi:hypothetical protein